MVAAAKAERIEINIGYSYSRIVNSRAAISLAAKKFSAFSRNAQFTSLYRNGLWDGRQCMVNKKDGSFGTGLVPELTTFMKATVGDENVVVKDLRTPPEKVFNFEWKLTDPMRKAQDEALAVLHKSTIGIIKMPTGTGKCWAPGTPIMMYDGTIKPVEDIKIGDVLMGDDGTPRNVLGLGHGTAPMYKVTPTKGDPYIVNDAHILSLKYTRGCKFRKHGPKDGDLLDIELTQYLQLSNYHKHCLKGYRCGVQHFGNEASSLPIPPYLLGVWLGDGSRRTFTIYNPDKELQDEVIRICTSAGEHAELWKGVGTVDEVRIKHATFNTPGRHWWKYLKDNGVRDQKHVPHVFKTALWNDRLELLAGLVDSDGSLSNNGFDIIFKSKPLAYDTAFVARSLGLAAYVKECNKTCTNAGAGRDQRVAGMYYRVSISGNTDIVPCRVARKKAAPRQQKKDVLMTGIKVEPVGIGEYYGFTIDGNHRLLMGDFTVAHNTRLFSKLIQEMGVRTLVCVPTKELLYQTAEVLKTNIGGKDFKLGLWGDGKYPAENSSVVVAMYPTLISNRGKNNPEIRKQFIETMGAFELLICDECHKVCSNDNITKTWETIMDINAYYRFGFSATPFEKKDTVAELLQRSSFGNIIYDIPVEKAREDGYITPFTVYFIKPEYPKEYTRRGTTGMTWNEAHDYYIGTNGIRNRAVIDATKLLLEDGRKTLVIAQRIDHNEWLAKILAEEVGEENVYLLHGQLDSNYRKAAMKEYKSRHDPCVLVASSVGNDGIDIPDISGIVLAHGGKSFFQNVQRTGRGLRTFQGKENLVFVDFDDSELGRWFSQHTRARMGYYKDLGVEAINVQDL